MEINYIEYKNKAYCKSIGCDKFYCKDCGAYRFHEYLQENNFLIIKKDSEIITRNNYDLMFRKKVKHDFINYIFVNKKTKKVLAQPPFKTTKYVSIIEKDNEVLITDYIKDKEVKMVYIIDKDEWHLISTQNVIKPSFKNLIAKQISNVAKNRKDILSALDDYFKGYSDKQIVSDNTTIYNIPVFNIKVYVNVLDTHITFSLMGQMKKINTVYSFVNEQDIPCIMKDLDTKIYNVLIEGDLNDQNI